MTNGRYQLTAGINMPTGQELVLRLSNAVFSKHNSILCESTRSKCCNITCSHDRQALGRLAATAAAIADCLYVTRSGPVLPFIQSYKMSAADIWWRLNWPFINSSCCQPTHNLSVITLFVCLKTMSIPTLWLDMGYETTWDANPIANPEVP